MGADVLRLWVASADFSAEMTVSDEILKRAGESYRRMRNTARYFLSNIDGFDPQQHQVEHADLLALDRWAIDCAAQLQAQIISDYDVSNSIKFIKSYTTSGTRYGWVLFRYHQRSNLHLW